MARPRKYPYIPIGTKLDHWPYPTGRKKERVPTPYECVKAAEAKLLASLRPNLDEIGLEEKIGIFNSTSIK